jgi:hypothetical protein
MYLKSAAGWLVYYYEKKQPVKSMEKSAVQNEPIEVTFKVTGILEALGVPYLIGGSLANTLHGMV